MPLEDPPDTDSVRCAGTDSVRCNIDGRPVLEGIDFLPTPPLLRSIEDAEVDVGGDDVADVVTVLMGAVTGEGLLCVKNGALICLEGRG